MFQVFYCSDGCVMADVKELAQELNCMSNETFMYHANDMKNDFATWVSDVIGDQELAGGLRKTPDKVQAAGLVDARVTFLARRAA